MNRTLTASLLSIAALSAACGTVDAPALQASAPVAVPTATSSKPAPVKTAGTPASPEASIARLVADVASLPVCDAASDGALVYVKADGLFRVCDGAKWESLDLRGRDGRDGRDGLAGKDGGAGRDGRDGAAGSNGAAGAAGAQGAAGVDATGAATDYRVTCAVRWIDGNTKAFELEFHKFKNGEGFLRAFIKHGNDAPLAFADHLAADEMNPSAGVIFSSERYYDFTAPIMGIATTTFEYLEANNEIRILTMDPNGTATPSRRTLVISTDANPTCTRTNY